MVNGLYHFDQIWDEFVAIVLEIIFYVEDNLDQTFKQFLLAVKATDFQHRHNFVSDLLERKVQNLIGAVLDNFPKYGDSEALSLFGVLFARQVECKFEKLGLKQYQLLLWRAQQINSIQDHLPNSLRDGDTQPHGGLFLALLLKLHQYFWNEFNQRIFKYFSSNPKHFNHLLHLLNFSVRVEFCQLCQEDDHPIIFSYFSFHQVSELVYPLLQSMRLPKLVEDDEQVFLEHFYLLLFRLLMYFPLLA